MWSQSGNERRDTKGNAFLFFFEVFILPFWWLVTHDAQRNQKSKINVSKKKKNQMAPGAIGVASPDAWGKKKRAAYARRKWGERKS